MPRYFTQARTRARIEDEDAWEAGSREHVPTVCEHEAVDTGLIDQDGNAIMRAPLPIGFGRDDEW